MMIVVAVALVGLVLSQADFPTPAANSGNIAYIRVFNNLPQATGNGQSNNAVTTITRTFNANSFVGGTTPAPPLTGITYSGPGVTAFVTRQDSVGVIPPNPAAGGNVPVISTTPGFGGYTAIDLSSRLTGSSTTISVSIRQGSFEICPPITISAGTRATLKLSGTVTSNPVTSTCNSNTVPPVFGASCVVSETQTVSFTCQLDTSDTIPKRSCSTVPLVVFRNDQPTCDGLLRVKRTTNPTPVVGSGLNNGLATNEAIFLDTVFATTPRVNGFVQSPAQSLTRGLGYELGVAGGAAGTAISTAGTLVQAFVTGTAPTIAITGLATGYLQIVNAAHRVRSVTTVVPPVPGVNDGSLFYTIADSTSTAGVIQTGTITNNQALTSFIALPANAATGGSSYTIRFYPGTTTFSQIIGPFPVGTTAVPPLTTVTTTLNDGDFKVVVVTGSVKGTSQTTVTGAVQDVTPTAGTNVGDTEYVIFNAVETSSSLVFAAPTSTACNILNTTPLAKSSSFTVRVDSLRSRLNVPSGTAVPTTFTGFTATAGTSQCGALGQARGTVSLQKATLGTGVSCARRFVVLTGRAYDSTNLSPSTLLQGIATLSGGANCATCLFTQERIGDLNFVDNNGSGDAFGSVQVDIPACNCVNPTTTCSDGTTTQTVTCQKDEFSSLQDKVDQQASSIATELGRFQSTFDSLSTQLRTQINNQLGAVGTRDNQEEIIDILEDQDDELEDILNEAEDAVDAGDDAENRAKKAESGVKKNNNLNKKILERVKNIEEAVVPPEPIPQP